MATWHYRVEGATQHCKLRKKVFFFEKKKQKTFAIGRRPIARPGDADIAPKE
jgi:hypothetical protein